MDRTELDRQIAKVLEEGFDNSFAAFCAKTFSSYTYPPESLAAARMHALYLRLALEALSSPETRNEILESVGHEESREQAAFRKTVRESYRAALGSDHPFCEIFVEMWCVFFSSAAE